MIILIGSLEMFPKALERGLEVLEIGRRAETIQTNSIVEIDQNIEKSSTDLSH